MKVLLAFIVLFAQSASAQFLIHGKLLDSKSKEPLTYASVAFLNENKGTLTNNDGYFEISSKDSTVQFRISYLGYEAKIFNFTSSQPTKDTVIYLTPKTFNLSEVVITPERLDQLIKALYDKLRRMKNHKYFADAFYRDYTTIDNSPVNASEIFYNVTLNQSGIGNWNFVQGRTAEAKNAVEKPTEDYLYASIANNSSFIRNFPLTKYSPSSLKEDFNSICILPVCEDPEKNYYYFRTGEKMIDNKKVSAITFLPKRLIYKPAKTENRLPGPLQQYFLFTGKMEVIEDDLQIIYLEIELKNIRFFDRVVQVPYKYWRDPYVDSCYFRHVWQYKLLNNDWVPERIGNVLNFRQRSKRDKTFKKLNRTSSDIYFFNYGGDPAESTKQNSVENDRKLIRENTYDPFFWKNNSTVLTEIPFEKNIQESLMKNGFYGNLFPGGIAPEHYNLCSDLENKTIRRLNENYYFSLKRMSVFYNPRWKDEIDSLFKFEIFPMYRRYIDRIINHSIHDTKLNGVNKMLDKIPDTFAIEPILKLWTEMNPESIEYVKTKLTDVLPSSLFKPVINSPDFNFFSN